MKLLTSTLCALSIAIAAPSFAQDTTTPEPEAETKPAAADLAAQADEVFPLEEEKKGPYVRETHGSWEVRCAPNQQGEVCNLYHLLSDKEGNSVAELNIEILPAGGQASAGVTLVTPLGTLLTSQVGWRIDAGKARRYPFSWCEAAGCISRFGLTKGDIAAMKKGANAKITLVSVTAPKTPIELEMSLTGFTAAFDSIPAPVVK